MGQHTKIILKLHPFSILLWQEYYGYSGGRDKRDRLQELSASLVLKSSPPDRISRVIPFPESESDERRHVSKTDLTLTQRADELNKTYINLT